MKVNLKINGIDEIRKQFAETGKRLGEVMAVSAAKGMKEIEKQAKYNATRGGEYPLVESGELVAGIKSKLDGKGKDFAVAHVGFIDASAELAVKANSVEYGHIMTVTDPDSGVETIQHVPAKPFMRPALEQTKRKVSNIFKNELEKQLK
jgi:HK97 gp10 family phage protein